VVVALVAGGLLAAASLGGYQGVLLLLGAGLGALVALAVRFPVSVPGPARRSQDERERPGRPHLRGPGRGTAPSPVRPDELELLVRDGTVIHARTPTGRFAGAPVDEVVGRDLAALIAADDLREVLDRSTCVGRGATPPVASWSGPGSAGAVEVAATAAGSDAVVWVRDVEAQRAQLRALQQRVATDPLTGLANRSVLVDRIEVAARLAARSGRHYVVAVLDVDHFKNVNDRFGHAVGDRVLVEVGQALSATVRKSDTVVRLAGDEFVVVAAEVRTIGAARALLERLVEGAQLSLSVGERAVCVSVSAGAVVGGADPDPDRLVEQADLAMYLSKRRGGGRCTLRLD